MIRRVLVGFVVLVAALSAAPLLADSTVRCESKGGRKECYVGNIGRVEMRRQRSLAECKEGESWGYDRDSIWVDDGCRADFDVFTRRRDRDRDRDRNDDRDGWDPRGRRTNRLICESSGGRRLCPADTTLGVELARTLGSSECVRGRSWGFDDRGVWVDRGCRAEFVIGTDSRDDDRGRRPPAQLLVCESDYNRRHVCAADTRFGVELKRQISRTECVFNRTWGYDRDGVWVANGCRAEFLVGGR